MACDDQSEKSIATIELANLTIDQKLDRLEAKRRAN